MPTSILLGNLAWLTANRLEDLMATVDQFTAAIAAINDATNAVAEEVAALKAIIESGGLNPAQEQSVLDALGSIEAKLKAIAAPEPPTPA